MKANELMLGDLVMYYGRVSRIDGLWQDIAHVEGEPEEQYADMQEIEPILSCRYKTIEEAHKAYNKAKSNHIIALIEDYNHKLREDVYIELKEHALRLCGLNEIADNFKV